MAKKITADVIIKKYPSYTYEFIKDTLINNKTYIGVIQNMLNLTRKELQVLCDHYDLNQFKTSYIDLNRAKFLKMNQDTETIDKRKKSIDSRNKLKIENLSNKISKDELIQLFGKDQIGLENYANRYNVSLGDFNMLIDYYNLRNLLLTDTKTLRNNAISKYYEENFGEGIKNSFQTNDVKEKIKATNSYKYGVEYSSQSEIIKEKIRDTKLKKNGYMSGTFGSPEFKNGMMEKYGVEWPSHDENIVKKQKDAKIKKYGYYAGGYGSPEFKKGMMEKYGVEWPTQNEEVKLKIDFSKNINLKSKMNEVFADKLASKNKEMIIEYEKRVNSYYYDIFLPKNNTLIEINPTISHNTIFSFPFITKKTMVNRPRKYDYHKKKLDTAIENGYRCIMIWDWDDMDKILYSLTEKKKISGHKCNVKEITKKEADLFLEKYHFQGTLYRGQDIKIGLFYKDELISVMTFGKSRYNKKYQYEFLRYASSDYVVHGGINKMWQYFINTYDPTSVISYSDKSKFDGNFFVYLGFKKEKYLNPSIHWYSIKDKKHFNHNSLIKLGADRLLGTSYGSIAESGYNNEDIMIREGYLKIYDCGQQTWIWDRSQKKIN